MRQLRPCLLVIGVLSLLCGNPAPADPRYKDLPSVNDGPPTGTLIVAPITDSASGEIADPRTEKLSPNKKYRATVVDRVLNVYENGRLRWKYPKSASYLESVFDYNWSPDSQHIVIVDNRYARVLSAPTGKIEYTFSGLWGGKHGTIWSPDWSNDGNYIVAIGIKSGGDDPRARTVMVWDSFSRRVIFENTDRLIGSQVRWAPDSKRIAYNSDDCRIRIWDVGSKTMTAVIPLTDGRSPIAWSADGKYIASANIMNGETTIYKISTGKPIARHEFQSHVDNLHWASDRKALIASSILEKKPMLWNLDFDASGSLKEAAIPEKKLGDKGYIPRTIDECCSQLNAELSPDVISDIKNGDARNLGKYHMSVGMWIRNSWGHSEFARELRQNGPMHWDDFSSIVLSAYRHFLRGEPNQAKRQIKASNRFWTIMGDHYYRGLHEEEQIRLAIRDKMMELNYSIQKVPAIKVPDSGTWLPVRYATKFRKTVLFTSLKSLKGEPDGVCTPAFLVDLKSHTVSAIRIPEVDQIYSAVVIANTLYLYGLKNGVGHLIALDSHRKEVPLPPGGQGWLPKRCHYAVGLLSKLGGVFSSSQRVLAPNVIKLFRGSI